MSQDDRPPTDLTPFRAALAIVALAGGLIGMTALFFVPIPAGNREALLLALGLVLGWGSTVIGYEFGSSPPGGGRRTPASAICHCRQTFPLPNSPQPKSGSLKWKSGTARRSSACARTARR